MEETKASPKIPRKLQGAVRRRSSNLTPALLLLPSDRRRDALLLGEFCRLVDNLADDPDLSAERKKAALESWLRALAPEYAAELPADFREMICRRRLDRQLLSEIVHGMLMDTEQGRYATFGELEHYCRRVASAVGLNSALIFGASGSSVERYAEELGIALQLTNILRDVAEDAAMDRIYLPMEDLERFGVTEQDILRGNRTPEMTHLLNHQAERADSWFAKAELAWSELPANQRRLMRPARLMSAIYRELLLAMHRDRYDVFAKRYRVSSTRKLVLLIQVLTMQN
jgi:phytoene synthase